MGSVTHSFDFFVQERGSGADLSAISYRVKTVRPGPDQEDTFVAIAVTGVTFYNLPGVTPGTRPASGVDTATFTGTGWWNGRSGYTFEARATDAGEPGRGHDVFAITDSERDRRRGRVGRTRRSRPATSSRCDSASREP